MANNGSDSNSTTVVYASQVIESPQRRFITDTERYAIAQLQKNGMLKMSYDTNEDYIVDRADKADTAELQRIVVECMNRALAIATSTDR